MAIREPLVHRCKPGCAEMDILLPPVLTVHYDTIPKGDCPDWTEHLPHLFRPETERISCLTFCPGVEYR